MLGKNNETADPQIQNITPKPIVIAKFNLPVDKSITPKQTDGQHGKSSAQNDCVDRSVTVVTKHISDAKM